MANIFMIHLFHFKEDVDWLTRVLTDSKYSIETFLKYKILEFENR